MKLDDTQLWKSIHNTYDFSKKETIINDLIEGYDVDISTTDSILITELYALIYLVDFDTIPDLKQCSFDGHYSKFIIMFILIRKGYCFKSEQEALEFICEGLAHCEDEDILPNDATGDIVTDIYNLFRQFPSFFEEEEVKKYLYKEEYVLNKDTFHLDIDAYYQNNFLNLPVPKIKFI